MNTLSPRLVQGCRRALLGFTCLVAMGAIPSFADAASHPTQTTGESLRVVALFRTVTGGRTIACPSRMLYRYIRLAGCQKVTITTQPGSKVLLTLRYNTNKHYILHKTGYADAFGLYQWVFPVAYTPSTHALHRSLGIVDVTAVLGHAVKVRYTVFRVL